MSSQMHLFSFILNSPINHTVGSWANPEDGRIEGLQSTDYWRKLGETLERGRFDAVFFADIPAAYDNFRDSSDDTVKYGVCWPNHDPMIALTLIASATKHLGLVVTKSVSAMHPYDLVRSLSTLDYVSGGRVGWNVVTGHLRAEHRAFGLTQMEHDERYDRAEEYLGVCRALWNGIEPDAIVLDRDNAIFADPAKVKRLQHTGTYLSCDAIPPVLPSAQRSPVLFQAGSSSRGQKFAINNAEAIFAVQHTESGMHKFMNDLSELATSEGVPVPKVTFGVQVVLGETPEKAEQHRREMAEHVSLDGSLARLSGTLGIDFSSQELDQPLTMQKTQAGQGSLATKLADRNLKTLREVAMLNGTSTSMMQIVGTPEHVAAELERLWKETGCFGFNMTPTTSNDSMERVVDQVVPILQQRGVLRTDYAHTTLRDNLLEDSKA
jgi:FMN-dependent oxidoreductase (nitrilotriacetate monooxygenase family)